MGASESKPDAKGGYQWKASGPPSVSMPVLESLQSSPETDASRAKLIEKQIQTRVSEELQKAQQRQSEALATAHEKLASVAEKLHAEGGASKDDKKETDSHNVSKELDALRSQLESRKQVRELPESVETARSAVIRCLREHDRRPLDCWQEVEDFKAEVKKLERTWVDKVTA